MNELLPNPTELTKIISELWEGDEYRNTSSAALEKSWMLIAESFNDCVYLNRQGIVPTKRAAIPAQTGTGKTTAMIQYAAHLKDDTGMLIVTMFKDEADKIMEGINRGLHPPKATTYHSSSKQKYNLDGLKEYQVLIITHSQFVGSTDRNQNEVGVDRNRIHKFYNYRGNKRDLIVIDESVETIKDTNLEYNDLHMLENVLSGYIKHKDSNEELIPKVVKEIETLDALLKFLERMPDKGQSEIVVDINELSDYLKSYNLSFKVTKELNNSNKLELHKSQDGPKSKKSIARALESIQFIVNASWLYYTSNKDALRTARDAIPEGISIVSLDATSSVNHYYNIHDDIKLISMPTDVRDYSNVELFLSEGQNTGKTDLTKPVNIGSYADSIIQEICKPFNQEKIAVFTHGKLDKKITSYLAETEHDNDVQIDHFGNLTGKNNYQDCTTAYLIGTPYVPAFVITNIHALSSTGLNCFNNDKLIKEERLLIEYTRIAAELIQAINRISCRNVIDSNGNCPDTKVYLTMPENTKLSGVILDSIKKQMPGIQVKSWDFILLRGVRRGYKSKFEDLVIQNLSKVDGTIKYSDFVKDMNVNGKTMTSKERESLRNRLKAPQSNDLIAQALIENSLIFSKVGSIYLLAKI